MIEYALLFALGFLAATLAGLLIAPAVQKRVVKFTEKRMLATMPLSPQEVRAQKDMKMPWLVEPKGSPFSELLGIDSIPRMILLSPEGKVLFNGHPEEPGLWDALKKLDSAIQPPKDEAEAKN